MLTDFEKMVDNFDGYMLENGFVSIPVYADIHGLSASTVRNYVCYGAFDPKDVVKVGQKINYIRLNAERIKGRCYRKW